MTETIYALYPVFNASPEVHADLIRTTGEKTRSKA